MQTFELTSIAIKIPGNKIFLENNQLFFLEQFLRKQLGHRILIKKMKIVDGVLLIDLKHDGHRHQQIKKSVDVTCDYLKIFQGNILQDPKVQIQVRLKRFPIFHPNNTKPQKISLKQ